MEYGPSEKKLLQQQKMKQKLGMERRVKEKTERIQLNMKCI